MSSRFPRLAAGAALAASGAFTAWLLACGPFLEDLETVRGTHPAHLADYARGDVGIVRPRFARRYLVQAYRRFSDVPPLASSVKRRWDLAQGASGPGAVSEWLNAVKPAPAVPPGMVLHSLRQDWRDIPRDRRVGQSHQWFENCPAGAFENATRTLTERIARYGASTGPVRDWVAAQTTVFLNCGDGPLMLPDAAPPAADRLTRADRAYQTAAAYFYGMQYDEAARRFRVIAADAASPWQPYGRYLEARATIRLATLPEDSAPRRDELLASAEQELRLVLADRGAASLHPSTRGLLEFVAARRRPVQQLHALSKILATAAEVSDRQMLDYQVLMDRIVGDTVDYEYGSVGQRAAVRQDDDLSDWILAMQGTGPEGSARARARWKATRSLPWLVAVLWTMPPQHADAAAALAAAADVPATSPSYPTIAFLRVRLLADRGGRDEARAVLSTLPSMPDGLFQAESVNLIRAERFRLATSFDELLASAARAVVTDADLRYWPSAEPGVDRRAVEKPLGTPTLDLDAALVFTYRLPLDRAVAAANAAVLPDRLARRVAISAFTRAVLLRRYDAALSVLSRLRELAPPLGPDLDRFAAASSDPDRHFAAIRLLLRTPGMRPAVRALDDSESYTRAEPARGFEHMLQRNWWCDFDSTSQRREASFWGDRAETLVLVYPNGNIPFPEFLTADERARAEGEVAAVAKLGVAPDYLADEAVKWARARPRDLDAAEALAHAVEGARWSCGRQRNTTSARLAFQTLHRLFPRSEWARKTKYWY